MKIKIKRKINSEEKIYAEEIIDFLIKQRSIKNKDEFLKPKKPSEISFEQLFSNKEREKFINKLKEVKKKSETIVVYTDYDADGLTGGAILWETLYLLGFKVMPYVPHRRLEGYGFSKKGIDNVKNFYNPSLIISVDHGITAGDKIAYAKKMGISVVISDHHLKSDKIPDNALAIFHNSSLSGSGVSFFLAREIYESFKLTDRDIKEKIKLLEEYFLYDYLCLATIGTIADLVPLIGPSRSLVKYGLSAFSSVKRFGIKHILQEAGIKGRKITPYEIGFMIAPRINALGRLGHSIDTLRLLCTQNEERAQVLARKIGKKNKERQDILDRAIKEAKENFNNQISELKFLPKIIILYSDQWHEGIIGLIASKMVEEFYRPTIIMSINNGFVKGSARSIPGFDITSLLRKLNSDLLEVGGHPLAAGFTLLKENLNKFSQKVLRLGSEVLKEEDIEKKIEVDLDIPLNKVTLFLAKQIERLEPFGIGNLPPLFYSEGRLTDARLFGNKNQHLKIFLEDNFSSLEIIFFNEGNQFLNLKKGEFKRVCYYLGIDRWDGKEKLIGMGKAIF